MYVVYVVTYTAYLSKYNLKFRKIMLCDKNSTEKVLFDLYIYF